MSEEALCSVFSGFYKKKRHITKLRAKGTLLRCLCFSTTYTNSVNPALMQAFINSHVTIRADRCRCDQPHACLCTAPSVHKQLL